jgi:hypothetical protein
VRLRRQMYVCVHGDGAAILKYLISAAPGRGAGKRHYVLAAEIA